MTSPRLGPNKFPGLLTLTLPLYMFFPVMVRICRVRLSGRVTPSFWHVRSDLSSSAAPPLDQLFFLHARVALLWLSPVNFEKDRLVGNVRRELLEFLPGHCFQVLRGSLPGTPTLRLDPRLSPRPAVFFCEQISIPRSFICLLVQCRVLQRFPTLLPPQPGLPPYPHFSSDASLLFKKRSFVVWLSGEIPTE